MIRPAGRRLPSARFAHRRTSTPIGCRCEPPERYGTPMTHKATDGERGPMGQPGAGIERDTGTAETDASVDGGDLAPADPSGLSFADAPRLELDELLQQLRDRADDVLATQG